MFKCDRLFRLAIEFRGFKLWARNRNVRTLTQFANSILKKTRNPSSLRILSEQDTEQFKSFFLTIIEDLTNHNLISSIDEVNDRMGQIMNYCVSGGKQVRPSLLIAAYKFIRTETGLVGESIEDAIKLAWCLEMMASFFLVLDDILDNSEKRRGKLCWYKNEDVGMNAINDAVLIQMGLFELLKKYFINHKFYQQIVDVFLVVNLKTFVGQTLDCNSNNISTFSWKKFNEMCDNKTGYYTYYFPIVLAMYLAERADLQLQEKAFDIFMELGRFYQYQNDYLDCFSKFGTDIEEGKCTWLILSALEKASPKQKNILEKNYGKCSKESVEKIKNIYIEMNLNNSFDDQLEKTKDKVNAHLKKIENSLSQRMMRKLALVSLGYETYL
ncbi:hypothetical protein WA026_015710 [Henosepilachna vigintioctopunctata]|uniref:Farnesyl pyrophosphate synthase n=1 Tax=Henosepilachna vigintioctopunctata TaxID=420089 RepID=A0AAW1UZ85_9CUCU